MSDYLITDSISALLGPFAVLAEEAHDLRVVLKNLEHRYLYVNPHWLKSVGIEDVNLVLGKTAVEVFSHWRGDRYIEEEKLVMESGETLDYFEDWLNAKGENERYRAIKAPWMEHGVIMGMVNISIPAHRQISRESRADIMPNVVEWLTGNATENVSIAEIAQRYNMSRSSFERLFTQHAGQSPSKFRLNLRIEKAKELLGDPSVMLSELALQCGFCDQSHFTRVFRQHLGQTPSQYRKQGK
ncbi:MAG: helix-turn-helix domain-containing protein [Akkermansiaceae bacterium]